MVLTLQAGLLWWRGLPSYYAWQAWVGPVLPVSLLVRPLLPHLSKLLVTVHPVALMAANFKDNFGGKNSNLFFGGPSGCTVSNGHGPCAACVTACTATVASPL
jgi:hypothetical protein